VTTAQRSPDSNAIALPSGDHFGEPHLPGTSPCPPVPKGCSATPQPLPVVKTSRLPSDDQSGHLPAPSWRRLLPSTPTTNRRWCRSGSSLVYASSLPSGESTAPSMVLPPRVCATRRSPVPSALETQTDVGNSPAPYAIACPSAETSSGSSERALRRLVSREPSGRRP
jgi:hypothetical protein